MTTPAERAQGDLTQLNRRLRELQQRLRAGDRAQRHHQAPTAEQLAARASLQRAERADAQRQMAASPHGTTPLGASPAPLDLGLVDLLRDIHADIYELEEAVRERVAHTMRPAAPHKRIQRLIDLLPLAAHARGLLDHIAAEARRLNRRAGVALGETEPLVRLGAVRCPTCSALSLWLRPDADLVECFNPGCACVDDLCGCRDVPRRTRHQWPATHWPDLATATHEGAA